MDAFYLISNLALWGLVLVQGVILVVLMKTLVQYINRLQYKILLRKPVLFTVKVGDKAPVFREPNQKGEMISLTDNGGRSTLLVFTVDNSQLCKEIFPRLPEIHRLGLEMRVCVIEDTVPNGTASEAPDSIHYFRSFQVFKMFQIKRVPYFMLVNEDGYVVDADPISSYKELELRLQKYYRLAS